MIAIWMFESFFLPFVSLIIWLNITSGGKLESQLITYFLLFPLISMFTGSWHGVFMAADIRTGRINTVLTKPIFPLMGTIANNLAEKSVKIFFLAPFILLGFYLYPTELSPTLTQIVFFVPSVIFAYLLTLSIETALGVSAFWLDEVSSLKNLHDIADYTFGGIFVPVFLYPPFSKP